MDHNSQLFGFSGILAKAIELTTRNHSLSVFSWRENVLWNSTFKSLARVRGFIRKGVFWLIRFKVQDSIESELIGFDSQTISLSDWDIE